MWGGVCSLGRFGLQCNGHGAAARRIVADTHICAAVYARRDVCSCLYICNISYVTYDS